MTSRWGRYSLSRNIQNYCIWVWQGTLSSRTEKNVFPQYFHMFPQYLHIPTVSPFHLTLPLPMVNHHRKSQHRKSAKMDWWPSSSPVIPCHPTHGDFYGDLVGYYMGFSRDIVTYSNHLWSYVIPILPVYGSTHMSNGPQISNSGFILRNHGFSLGVSWLY